MTTPPPERAPWLTRYGPALIGACLVAGLLLAIGIQPTRQLLAQRERIAGMNAELGRTQKINKDLDRRIERLRDADYIEQRAREQIGLVYPGETAFVVMPPSEDSQARKRRARRHEIAPIPVELPEPSFVEGLLDFLGLGAL
ncbi:MAG TPA: septum formation initiator family protein [Actinomycetota bacterium]|nr:septum formation initiator family protein [Actinomycetota bacterium]